MFAVNVAQIAHVGLKLLKLFDKQWSMGQVAHTDNVVLITLCDARHKELLDGHHGLCLVVLCKICVAKAPT